jgi:hypothetical protein
VKYGVFPFSSSDSPTFATSHTLLLPETPSGQRWVRTIRPFEEWKIGGSGRMEGPMIYVFVNEANNGLRCQRYFIHLLFSIFENTVMILMCSTHTHTHTHTNNTHTHKQCLDFVSPKTTCCCKCPPLFPFDFYDFDTSLLERHFFFELQL